jgi:hypothetical protein
LRPLDPSAQTRLTDPQKLRATARIPTVPFRRGFGLSELGRNHAPALIANAEALQAGQEQMETIIDGQSWPQPTSPYQAKCLQWINEEYGKLGTTSKSQVDAILEGAGCGTILI